MNPHVTAVLLAAGSSQRMGQLKQLLPLNGKPIVRHSLDAILSSGIDEIIVVLGSDHEEVVKALNGPAVNIVINETPGSDMAESIRTGLRAIRSSSTGILISLSDQPLVLPETIKALLNCHKNEQDNILIPQYGNKKGHPVLFPGSLIADIFSGGNLRDIMKKYSHKISLVPVPDEGVIIDIDTMEDYRNMLTKAGNGIP